VCGCCVLARFRRLFSADKPVQARFCQHFAISRPLNQHQGDIHPCREKENISFDATTR
jgi:hypothetical protein